jgi:hypothetical protein
VTFQNVVLLDCPPTWPLSAMAYAAELAAARVLDDRGIGAEFADALLRAPDPASCP